MSKPGGGRGTARVLQVLDHLAGWTDAVTLPMPRTATLHDIASALAIPQPTAFRILQALVDGGWVEKAGGEFQLAFKCGFIGVGIHESLKRQAESLASSVERMEAVRAAGSPIEAQPAHGLGGPR